MPFVWEKFYKADKSHSQEGNGLGLSLVKRIIELHKGTIEIKSKINKLGKRKYMFDNKSNISIVLDCDANYVDGTHSRALFDKEELWAFAEDYIDNETIIVNKEFVDNMNNTNNAKNAKSIYNELLKVVDMAKASVDSNYSAGEEVQIRAIVREHRTHKGRPQVFLEIPGVSAKWVDEYILEY